MNVWRKFEDSVWRKQAEQLQHKNAGGTWQVEKTDDKQTKQHKLKIKDWLFKSNLTEELLLNHPTPDDVKLFQDLRRCDIWNYFDPSDICKISGIEAHVIHNRKSLNDKQLKKINDCITRAKRLKHRELRRVGMYSGKENYEKYKQEVKKVYSDTK